MTNAPSVKYILFSFLCCPWQRMHCPCIYFICHHLRVMIFVCQACWYLLHNFNLVKYLLSSLIVPVYSQSGRSQWKQPGHLQLDNLIPIGSPFDLPAAVHIVVRSAFIKAALFLTAAIKFLQCSASALDRLVAHTVIRDAVHLDFCHRLSPLNKVFRPSTGG